MLDSAGVSACSLSSWVPCSLDIVRQLKREEREDKQNSSVFNQLKESWGDEDSDDDGW